MEKAPFEISLLVFLLVAAFGVSNWVVAGVAAGGYNYQTFRCPRMIDCNAVCQGFPNCCIGGRCLCEKCPTSTPLLKPNPNQLETELRTQETELWTQMCSEPFDACTWTHVHRTVPDIVMSGVVSPDISFDGSVRYVN